jgi:adenylosuccinate synthase
MVTDFPASLDVLAACKPIYEMLPGWSEDISNVRELTDLPPNARAYISRIESLVETPVSIVSVGKERDQTIIVSNPFN